MVDIRAYNASTDKSFVYSTFLRGNKHGCDYNKAIQPDAFFAENTIRLDEILKRLDVVVDVACLAEDHDIVLAYVIVEPGVVHWAFTKEVWRNQGLMKKLMDPWMCDLSLYTHTTKPGHALAAKHNLTFVPYLDRLGMPGNTAKEAQ